MVSLAPGNNTIYVTVIIPNMRFCRDDYDRDPQITLDGRANRSPGVSPWTWLGRQAHRRGSYYQLDPQQCASAGTKIRPRLSRGGSGHVAALEDTERVSAITTDDGVFCNDCGAPIKGEPPVADDPAQRKPCPRCGSIVRNLHLTAVSICTLGATVGTPHLTITRSGQEAGPRQ